MPGVVSDARLVSLARSLSGKRKAPRVNAVPSARSPSASGGRRSSRALVGDLARLRMLSRISEQVGEGVVVADNDGWFQYVNPEFAVQHASTVE